MVGSTLFQLIFEDMSTNANSAQTVRRHSYGRFFLGAIVATLALAALWMVIAWQWNYSEGERAGWVQKFSKKGWLCKTWEGEIALVSMPGAIPEKFEFTVLDDAVAAQINRYMGQRVSLTYAQKVGLPTSCFGDTRYYVTAVLPVNELQQFNVTAADILNARHSERFEALMKFQVERAQAVYDEAFALLPKEDRRAQRPGLMMAAIYRTLLDEITRDGYHVLNQRISLTPIRKLWLAWKTYVFG